MSQQDAREQSKQNSARLFTIGLVLTIGSKLNETLNETVTKKKQNKVTVSVRIDLFHYDVTVCSQNAQNCLVQMIFPKKASDDAPDGSNRKWIDLDKVKVNQ